MPYISITPTFSVCPEHGYIKGEEFSCPTCGHDTEVWSRVVGFIRPVNNFHVGKRKEYSERKKSIFKWYKSSNEFISKVDNISNKKVK